MARRHYYIPEIYYFSVGDGRKVIFSPGNLQYRASENGVVGDLTHNTADGVANGSFRFAENQWDLVGITRTKSGLSRINGNVYQDDILCDNSLISETYTGWIDMFGWGTSGYNSKHPYMSTTTNANYGNGANSLDGTYYDWGVYNEIYNPKTRRTEPCGTWRTISRDECKYMVSTRDNASSKRISAQVNGVNGIVFLPDNWKAPSQALETLKSSYTLDEWRLMETGGGSSCQDVEQDREICLKMSGLNTHSQQTTGHQARHIDTTYMATLGRWIREKVAASACQSDL